ncbi:hypothetical protein LO771_14665 [Streptacidiphilus sp. ASG 303]|uniref:hypothetical protein n=1 Tax=Streptacidiphilus sp. ASG 303 TaxID=2896847 RepID=UPI001E3B831E|nr:hypothetical protein [Streptacidiphilus sp. ASG 303]MCD0483603.1 hypothetical protein [Streptacidiphilus sp. ASG 303]
MTDAPGPADTRPAGPGPAPGDAAALPPAGGRRPPVCAPWVRTRLRSAPAAAGALALLVLALSFLAAAAPRALDRYADTALHRDLASRSPVVRSIDAEAVLGPAQDLSPEAVAAAVSPARLAAVERRLRDTVRPPLRIDPAAVSYGVSTSSGHLALTDPGLPEVDGLQPTATLAWRQGADAHVRMAAGRPPRAAPAAGGAGGAGGDGGDGGQGGFTVEVMVSRATADLLRVRPGSLLHLRPDTGPPFVLRVSGVYTALSAADPYWGFGQTLLRPALASAPPPGSAQYWHVGMLVGDASVRVLPRAGTVDAAWHHPVAADGLAAREVAAAEDRLDDLVSGTAASRLRSGTGVPGGLSVTSPLPAALAAFDRGRAAAAPLLAVAGAGLAGVAGAVLLMAGGLAADRRTGELALLRARGAGLPALAGRLAAETAAVALPAAAAGLSAALLLLPTARWGASAAAAAAVAGLVVLVVPLRAVLPHRGRGTGPARADVARTRPSRRRTVLDLAVLAAAAGAVAAVRQRGIAAGGVDPLVSGTPLLLGLAGALVLLRVYPWPLRLLARVAAGRRGAVPFLGLARAARSPASGTLLPLLALLLALTVAVFGGTVLYGISDGRTRAALAQVGADARIESGTELPPGLPRTVAELPGVRSAVPLRVQGGLGLLLHQGGMANGFTLVVADTAAYARLSAATGIGRFGTGLLRGGGAVPALASPALAARIGGGAQGPLVTTYGSFDVRVAGTLAQTPAARDGGDFLVVPLEQVRARWARASSAPLPAPDLLLLTGPVDPSALHRTVERARGAEAATVSVRTEVLSALDRAPLPQGATALYAAAVASVAVLSVLAVLLSLARSAPGRAALLARLRTMGMTGGRRYRLVLLEVLPPLVAAAVAGTLLGLAAVPVLGAAVDLAGLAGTDVPTGLGVRLGPLLAPGAGLLALAVGAAAAETAVTGRRRIAAELRAGEQ